MQPAPQSISAAYTLDDLWVYDKPANVSLLADRSGGGDLWQQLQSGSEKPYLVHRLDKGTSGVLLVARNQPAQKSLTRAFNQRLVSKYYLAWVVGHFPGGVTYQADLPLCRGRKSRYRIAGPREQIRLNGRRFTITPDRPGLQALTHARLLHTNGPYSLVLIKPHTGRTHQIRVHMSWLGFPLVGDHLYGRPRDPQQQASRLMLHCHRLVIPGWGSFSIAPPRDFSAAAHGAGLCPGHR